MYACIWKHVATLYLYEGLILLVAHLSFLFVEVVGLWSHYAVQVLIVQHRLGFQLYLGLGRLLLVQLLQVLVNLFIFLFKLVISSLDGLTKLVGLDDCYFEVYATKLDDIINVYLVEAVLGLESLQDVVD